MVQTERLWIGNPQQLCHSGVVTQLGMRIQRQMGGEQGDIMLEQYGEPLVMGTRDSDRLSPKESVVYKDRIGLHLGGLSECCQRGVDGTYDPFDFLARSTDLQSIQRHVRIDKFVKIQTCTYIVCKHFNLHTGIIES